jgi:hypothetical protein
MDKHDGGTAFPLYGDYTDNSETTHYLDYLQRGMSLRDYFAGRAMQCFKAEMDETDLSDMKVRKEIAKSIAIMSYEIADAMLIARKTGR